MSIIKFFKQKWTWGLLFVFMLSASCTNLTQHPYSQVTANNFFKTNEQLSSALGAAYSQLSGYAGHNGIFSAQENSTDETVIPQRGTDWYDGGQWIRAQMHTFDPKDDYINNTWTFCYGGVNACNRLIYQFDQLVQQGSVSQAKAASYTAELKVLRSLYYYWLLDLYGNVPIVKKFAGASQSPPNNANFQTGRDSVFDFVESNIKSNITKLSRENNTSTYGRMNVWAAHFLLAKLYLNAGVYTGKDRWQDVVAQCDSIINSGKFSLSPNYFDDFKTNNQHSPETIFAIPYDQVYFKGFNIAQMTLHYLSQQTFNLQAQPWNGYASLEDFYNSFDSTDVRKKGFLVGYQYDTKGNHLIDASAFSGEPHGDTLYFTPKINQLEPKAWREAGVRFHKFEYALGATADLSNDFPVFRYADVLLMKAEALWRMNHSSGEALRLVNMIRERAGLSDYSSLDAYKILLERGHEFYTELWRRQDLIRFKGGMHYHYNSKDVKGAPYPAGQTAFNDAWWDPGMNSRSKADPNTHVNVYPIPFAQLQANSNLHQNPGY
ncbi:MAG TPA: RagB/SusD family nutrient uptake outer membrane protein [Balneolales bacterium]|nr:RagB/SusD family nutrient uptake outer membrane protein [Balneolales bacterium]